jgi:hypothetical protein
MKQNTISRIAPLLRFARQQGIKVIHLPHGRAIDTSCVPVAGEPVVASKTSFWEYIQANNISKLIVAGNFNNDMNSAFPLIDGWGLGFQWPSGVTCFLEDCITAFETPATLEGEQIKKIFLRKQIEDPNTARLGETHFVSTFSILRRNVNHSPAFVSTLPPYAVEDSLYSFRLHASDPDSNAFGDISRYRFRLKPNWLSIDSLTGLIQGTPRIHDLTDTTVVVEAYDDYGGLAEQSFSLHIQHVNHPPQITSAPIVLAREDTVYAYRVTAGDIDSLVGDVLRYSLTVHPRWIAVDSLSGLITGIPAATNVGDTLLTVRASDNHGGWAEQSFILSVLHTNHPPVLTSRLDTVAVEDSVYRFRVRATDQDSALFHDVIRYRLVGPQTWLSIDSVTGLVWGTPRVQNLPTTQITVEARDNAGSVARQVSLIHITHINHLPFIVSTPNTLALEDQLYLYRVKADDPDTLVGDVMHYRLTQHPGWLSIDSLSGILSGIPGAQDVGMPQVTVVADDGRGGHTTQDYSLFVQHVNHAPTFVILPDTIATEDTLYSYRPHATDRDSILFGDIVRYRLVLKPSWISWDSATSRAAGTPIRPNVRDTLLAFEADDGHGGVSEYRFVLHVRHVNHDPVIISTAMHPAKEDSSYLFRVVAHDEDSVSFGDVITYGLLVRPSWLDLDNMAGIIHGYPRAENVGDTVVTVIVGDGRGGFATKAFALEVLHTNHRPAISVRPDTMATENRMYTSRVVAHDPDSALFGDVMRYRMFVRPGWLSVDSVSGVCSGVPPEASADTVCGLLASDGQLADSIRVRIHVQHVNDPPALGNLPPVSFNEDDSLFVPFTAWYGALVDPDDPDSVHSWSLFGQGHVRVSMTPGGVKLKAEQDWNGAETLNVVVADPGGLRDTAQLSVTVISVNDPPVITSTPDTLLQLNVLTIYAVIAHDVDFEDSVLTYSCRGPAWLRIDSTGTLLGWPGEPGRYPITVIVMDTHQAADSQSFVLHVVGSASANERPATLPTSFALHQNYPNPFNPSTTIEYDLPKDAHVSIKIYDVSGREVATLLDESGRAGYHSLPFDAGRLASGVYFYRLKVDPSLAPSGRRSAQGFVDVKKMLILK